jgi:hypothetical protein
VQLSSSWTWLILLAGEDVQDLKTGESDKDSGEQCRRSKSIPSLGRKVSRAWWLPSIGRSRKTTFWDPCTRRGIL